MSKNNSTTTALKMIAAASQILPREILLRQLEDSIKEFKEGDKESNVMLQISCTALLMSFGGGLNDLMQTIDESQEAKEVLNSTRAAYNIANEKKEE